MPPVPGEFIAIEGTDGSGKTVQFERLVLALPEKVRVATLDFPQYSEPSSYFVQKYLTGKYGGDVEPYAAAVLFAVDRFDVKLKVREWRDEGRLIIANRYVASNMAHQGAKIADKKEREHFYRWLYQLEYEVFGIPKPDLNIILHLPAEIAAELGARRARRAAFKGARDIHEEDRAYQKRAEEVYLEIAALFPHDFRVIECAPEGALLAPEAIHERVLAAVREVAHFS
jgi:dTMP kinase